MKLGVRNLPKYLVEKIGKENIKSALQRQEPEFVEGSIVSHMAGRSDYHKKGYANTNSKIKSRKKWRDIQNGVLPADPLYSPEQALENAGLS